MKKILFLFSLLAMTATAMAQTRTVNGAVIDKNGNPLPGAKVEAEGGLYTTVNADGSFALDVPAGTKFLKFSYIGIGDKKMKISNEPMLVELKKSHNWFFNVEGEQVMGDKSATFVGARVGYVGENMGLYARVGVPVSSSFESDSEVPTVTMGALGHVYGGLFVYGGLGYAKVYCEDISYNKKLERDGMAIDAGLLFKTGHFNMTLGYGLHTNCTDDKNHCFQFGLGYNF